MKFFLRIDHRDIGVNRVNTMETQHFLDQLVHLFRDTLKDNLTGIYLHGSLAMNCFNPKSSDIDLLIVAKNTLSKEIARRIIDGTLDLNDLMTSIRGVEYSVVLEKHLQPFEYPTPFELHYSEVHRDRYRTDTDYICGGFTDKDLAAHFMVAYHRGVTLYGSPLKEICTPIPKEYFIDSIYHDIKNAKQDQSDDPEIETIDPVYIVLNLCRVLMYLKEDHITSKKEGGEWGVQSLPFEYKDLIRQCLNKYNGSNDELNIDKSHLLRFIDYMMSEINFILEKIIRF